MKLKHASSIEDVTFLKGTWYRTYHTLDHWVWGPLPSRVCKLGKTFTPLAQIYSDLVRQPRFYAGHLPRLFLEDQAANLATFLQVPIVRAFVSAWIRRRDSMRENPLVPEAYAIQASTLYGQLRIREHAALCQVSRRYGCTIPDIVRLEAQIYNADQPYSFVENPLLVLLATTDYTPSYGAVS